MKYEIIVRRRAEGYYESEGEAWASEDSAPNDSVITKLHHTTTEEHGIALCVTDLTTKAAEAFGE